MSQRDKSLSAAHAKRGGYLQTASDAAGALYGRAGVLAQASNNKMPQTTHFNANFIILQ